MDDRLALLTFADSAELHQLVVDELMLLAKTNPEYWSQTHNSLVACCAHASSSGAKAIVVQRRVQDPDFLAEFSAYYCRQFAEVSRNCVRIHFFSRAPLGSGSDVLTYLEMVGLNDAYLGFITLRPIARTPIGASILKPDGKTKFVRCVEKFPVRIGGVSFSVTGTPFMQQDNAVGACAQASIWMALRTLRKREGDRVHDPAQISSAATRYTVSGRILPNRTGLTQPQMIEAIRAAGYSPHPITFWRQPNSAMGLGSKLNNAEIARAKRVIHAYVESEIPVLLILYTPSSAHAVVVIGHTFDAAGTGATEIGLSLKAGVAIKLTHASGWVPDFVIHNDNSGPYMTLESQPVTSGYSLVQTYCAIPLLPKDVFVTGEDALEFGIAAWCELLEEMTGTLPPEEVAKVSGKIVIRLLLLDKRKIRAWAVRTQLLPAEVRAALRTRDLPRRVWVFEFHLKDRYGDHAAQNAESLVGFVLLDSTADTSGGAILMAYFNLPAFTDIANGSLIIASSGEIEAIQTSAAPAVQPFRNLDDGDG